MTRGGFQSAVRVARDPSRFRRQGRFGVGRKLRFGTAAQAVGRGSYSKDVRPRACLEFASLAEGEGSRGVFRHRQRCRRGRGSKRHGERHPPGTEANTAVTLWRRDRPNPTGIP